MHALKMSAKSYTPIMEILRENGFEDPKTALTDFAMIIAMSKRSEFEEECNAFREKYHMTFPQFEEKIKGEKEVYTEWDDYMAWKFLEKALNHWNGLLSRLRNVLPPLEKTQ